MSTVEWKPGQGPRGATPGVGGMLRRVLAKMGTPGAGTPERPPLRALLWDMDGLLIDSEPLWTVAEEELAGRYGAEWTPEIKASCIGKRLDAAVPLMLEGFGVVPSPDAVAEASAVLLARMPELFARQLPVLPGAYALLDECRAAGLPCALVSSSYRVLVDACLAALGGDYFTVSLAGDEVSDAKPHPKPYLLAAAALGVAPGACVVLEDSVAGATAGVAAGCTTVLVPGEHVPPPATDEGWSRAGSLADLSLAELARRHAGAGAGSPPPR